VLLREAGLTSDEALLAIRGSRPVTHDELVMVCKKRPFGLIPKADGILSCLGKDAVVSVPSMPSGIYVPPPIPLSNVVKSKRRLQKSDPPLAKDRHAKTDTQFVTAPPAEVNDKRLKRPTEVEVVPDSREDDLVEPVEQAAASNPKSDKQTLARVPSKMAIPSMASSAPLPTPLSNAMRSAEFLNKSDPPMAKDKDAEIATQFVTESPVEVNDKRLKRLAKLLASIERLEERQKQGHDLTKEELDKLRRKPDILDEMSAACRGRSGCAR